MIHDSIKMLVSWQLIAATGCLAATEEEQAKYASWSKVMDNLGLNWDPYQVKTEDGWFLTMFRITGEVGAEPNRLQ